MNSRCANSAAPQLTGYLVMRTGGLQVRMLIVFLAGITVMPAHATGPLREKSPPERPVTFTAADSPFSWQVVESSESARPFEPDESILGAAIPPSSISFIVFCDERPYGGNVEESAWLVRYDHVLIPAPDWEVRVDLSVSLVFQVSTHQLIAAFTDPAPVWPGSGWSSADITKRVATFMELFPRQSVPLRSSVIDVLRHSWWAHGSPVNAGQITLRPRQFLNRGTITDANGNPTPKAIANGWIVEILGEKIGVNPVGGPMCTQVHVYRDGDLKYFGGLLL